MEFRGKNIDLWKAIHSSVYVMATKSHNSRLGPQFNTALSTLLTSL